jgi:hypothetical protein
LKGWNFAVHKRLASRRQAGFAKCARVRNFAMFGEWVTRRIKKQEKRRP